MTSGLTIIWNVPEQNVRKDLDYRTAIVNVLTFFAKYVCALKGQSLNLTFEINDASSGPDTRFANDFEYATVNALCDCFEKDLFQQFDEKIVEQMKTHTIKNYM